MIQFPFLQLLAQFFPSLNEFSNRLGIPRMSLFFLGSFGWFRGGGQKKIEQAFFRVVYCLSRDLNSFLLTDHLYRDVHQISNDRLHIATYVSNLGELAGFDLEER